MAATVLRGTTAVVGFAEEPSRDVDEYGFRRVRVNQENAATAPAGPVYDEFGFCESSQPQASVPSDEVADLKEEVRRLTGLCEGIYNQVYSAPRDEQDIQFASMISRLEGETGCFQESCAVPVPSTCCDTGCCDTCNPCCQPCCRCGVYAGFSAVFVRPYVKDDVAYISDPPPDDNLVQSFDRDFEFTPRVWLGYTGQDGLGVRATYWQLDTDAGPVSIVGTANNTPIFVQVIGASTGVGRNAFAGVGETFIAGHSIQLQTLDLELTREFRRNQSLMMLGLGLRWADMDQRFNATVLDAGNVLNEQVIHTHGFEGFGPTVSIFGLQAFGQSGWGVYGMARGSILFGERSQDIYEVKNAGANIGRDTYNGDEVLTIGELGFGLQYSHGMYGTYAGFIRVGYEGQIWFDAGGPTSTSGDLGLHGLLVGFGIEG